MTRDSGLLFGPPCILTNHNAPVHAQLFVKVWGHVPLGVVATVAYCRPMRMKCRLHMLSKSTSLTLWNFFVLKRCPIIN